MSPRQPQIDPTTAVEVLSVIGIWFGGIATAVAVWVALWISHRDWARADAERRDQERTQARLVSLVAAQPGGPVIVPVINDSDAPVRDVDVDFVARYEDPILRGYPTRNERIYHLPDRESRTFGIDIRDSTGAALPFDPAMPRPRPVSFELSLAFTDSAGLRWRRLGTGDPHRVLDPAGGVAPRPSSWWRRRKT